MSAPPPDADTAVVTVGDDGFMHVFDLTTRAALHSAGGGSKTVTDRTVVPLAASGSGIALVDRSRTSLHLRPWTLAAVKCATPDRLLCLAAASDGRVMVGGGAKGAAVLWDVPSGAQLGAWNAHHNGVMCVAFTDCDTVVVTGGKDSVIKAWVLAECVVSSKQTRLFLLLLLSLSLLLISLCSAPVFLF